MKSAPPGKDRTPKIKNIFKTFGWAGRLVIKTCLAGQSEILKKLKITL